MTTYVINGGDLLKAACSFNLIDIFAHGANCWSTMGAGIALHIGNNFPALREVDANDPRGPEQRLGREPLHSVLSRSERSHAVVSSQSSISGKETDSMMI